MKMFYDDDYELQEELFVMTAFAQAIEEFMLEKKQVKSLIMMRY